MSIISNFKKVFIASIAEQRLNKSLRLMEQNKNNVHEAVNGVASLFGQTVNWVYDSILKSCKDQSKETAKFYANNRKGLSYLIEAIELLATPENMEHLKKSFDQNVEVFKEEYKAYAERSDIEHNATKVQNAFDKLTQNYSVYQNELEDEAEAL